MKGPGLHRQQKWNKGQFKKKHFLQGNCKTLVTLILKFAAKETNLRND